MNSEDHNKSWESLTPEELKIRTKQIIQKAREEQMKTVKKVYYGYHGAPDQLLINGKILDSSEFAESGYVEVNAVIPTSFDLKYIVFCRCGDPMCTIHIFFDKQAALDHIANGEEYNQIILEVNLYEETAKFIQGETKNET